MHFDRNTIIWNSFFSNLNKKKYAKTKHQKCPYQQTSNSPFLDEECKTPNLKCWSPLGNHLPLWRMPKLQLPESQIQFSVYNTRSFFLSNLERAAFFFTQYTVYIHVDGYYLYGKTQYSISASFIKCQLDKRNVIYAKIKVDTWFITLFISSEEEYIGYLCFRKSGITYRSLVA